MILGSAVGHPHPFNQFYSHGRPTGNVFSTVFLHWCNFFPLV